MGRRSKSELIILQMNNEYKGLKLFNSKLGLYSIRVIELHA